MKRRDKSHTCFAVGRKLAYLVLLAACSSAMLAQNSEGASAQAAASSIRATHILGFEKVANNATGKLSIEGKALQFQKEGVPPAQVNIDSIQDILLGAQDKQVGGTPMALGRAAAPFGGGRVVALFSHKKYDTVTLEYVDSNGGFHGAIFQLLKGQGEQLKNQLVANGAHVTQPQPQDQPVKQNPAEAKQ